METEEIRRGIKERLAAADKVLVGIGAEWKTQAAAKAAGMLKTLLAGKDFYVITSLDEDAILRLGLEKAHMAAPCCVSFTDEAWNTYTDWLGRTLNRTLLILELGEGFERPGLFRWPFEKITAINQKAYLYRINKRLYQISEELSGRAAGIAADSVEFVSSLGEEGEKTYGSDQQ